MQLKLKDLKHNNAALLELLTENFPDMLWIKDVDGNYLYVNQAICNQLLMAKSTKEPIGKNDEFFSSREIEAHKDDPNWHTFGKLCSDSDKLVIENKKAIKFEESGNIGGKLLYLEVFKAPFYDKKGNILGTVGGGRDITKLKKIQNDLEISLKALEKQSKLLEYQATHDALTNLANRNLLLDRLSQAIKRAKRYNTKVALIFIDLDHFKEINDSFGHQVGDKILIDVSQRIKSKMRGSDTLARLGGDEFCIILNDIKDVSTITDIVTTGVDIVNEPFIIEDKHLYVSMSLGISICPDDSEDVHTLLKNADSAMYKAKSSGRNTYSFYNEDMTKKAYERISLETSLREALDNDEFEVYYQPQIYAQTNKIIGMEALVRWIHPQDGLIFPDKFIPLAEENGLIVQLDRVVMRKAIAQFMEWKKLGLNPTKLSMNLAMKQMYRDDFIVFLTDLLKEFNCLATEIELEVTESQIMNNPKKSIKILQQLSELGISISIDDFGTGYSSLAYLKKLPITKLKIDKTFIKDLPINVDDMAITKTIISLCDNLSLKVIAEGVEQENQKEFLLKHGCDLIQGYLYSKPIPAKEMTQMLKDNQNLF